MLPFPNISPVALEIGPLAIRWYALAYIAGVVFGWRYAKHLTTRYPGEVKPEHFLEFVSCAIFGILLGGRTGYVLFYNLDHYLAQPLDTLMLWHGGMSFHGGLAGMIIAALLFCRKYRLGFFSFTDILACVAPIGLFFGRLANFINGELFGRAADVPWAMVFPRGGDVPRHPSQLYEAALEGLLLLILMSVLVRITRIRARVGTLSGLFLVGYALFRGFAECFREPDVQIGFLAGGTTMGQLLCIPMLMAGIWILLRKPRVAS